MSPKAIPRRDFRIKTIYVLHKRLSLQGSHVYRRSRLTVSKFSPSLSIYSSYINSGQDYDLERGTNAIDKPTRDFNNLNADSTISPVALDPVRLGHCVQAVPVCSFLRGNSNQS